MSQDRSEAPPRERTQAITVALKARLSPEQLRGIIADLEQFWCDCGLIAADAPDGADVILLALHDACEATT